MTRYSYLVCPLEEYRKFYQIDVRREWAAGRIRIFHDQCLGAVSFTRDREHEYLKCASCGSRLRIDDLDVAAAIRDAAIAKGGSRQVTPRVRFSYLDPGEMPGY
jgi:hypothetical protein